MSQVDARMHLPIAVGDFTDFYACEEHARNGTGIRTGVRMLAPNWCRVACPSSCLHLGQLHLLLFLAGPIESCSARVSSPLSSVKQ